MRNVLGLESQYSCSRAVTGAFDLSKPVVIIVIISEAFNRSLSELRVGKFLKLLVNST